MLTKILFICLMGRDRSPKAAQIINKDFSDKFEARCAGVSSLADVPLTKKLVGWADKIICMEREHRNALFQKLPEARGKEVEVWNIANDFSNEDKELENQLREKIGIMEVKE